MLLLRELAPQKRISHKYKVVSECFLLITHEVIARLLLTRIFTGQLLMVS